MGAVAVPRDAQAFVTKHTPAGVPVRWAQATVSFEVDPALETAVPGAIAAIGAPLASWSALPGLPTLEAVPAKAPVAVANDQRNVIYWAPNGYARAGNALAITIATFDEQTGEMVDCDIVINGRHRFALLPSDATPSADAPRVSTEGGGEDLRGGTPFDLQHVVAHELGHALGLGDEPADSSAVMYPITAPGDASRRAPAADDAAGVLSIYAGQPPQPTSTSPGSGCGAQIAPASPAEGTSVLLVGVGLLGLRAFRTSRARSLLRGDQVPRGRAGGEGGAHE